MSITEKWQPTRNWHEASPRSWGLQVISRTITVNTRGNNDVQDITSKLNDLITSANLHNGTATLFVQGSTAGLTTLEFEPGVIEDLGEMFELMAPSQKKYKHEARWHDGNGHSHVRAALLGPSIVIPFVEGELTLGTWQQVVVVDFDNRARQREIVVQLMGN
ncbi:MAG TPA: secondary thiamine-phosphate synthase enzyme YjbQ [Chloroflexia bacterium]|nr:secondary thiamine-phosphate synthase enzyme YjbQ [Chloroflexia bacterium]